MYRYHSKQFDIVHDSRSITMMMSSCSLYRRYVVIVIPILLLLLDHDAVVASSSSLSLSNNNDEGIAVLGLGGMGTAVARCLAQEQSSSAQQQQRQVAVHVWNRSPPSDLTGLASSTTTRHTNMAYAVGNATTILVVIDNWEGAQQVTRNVVAEVLLLPPSHKQRTVIVFSTYTPNEIQEFAVALNHQNNNNGGVTAVNLVGGAIVGIPETICSPASLVLLSASPSAVAYSSSTKQLLDPLGTVVSIDVNDNDDNDPNHNVLGLASLLNIALILTITFGLAGSELALLMIQTAAAAMADSRSVARLLDVYNQLARNEAVYYIGMLLPLVSQSFADASFRATYVPATTLHALLQKVCDYLHESLHLPETFLRAYVAALATVQDPDEGPVAWTKPILLQLSSSTTRPTATTTTATTTTTTTLPSLSGEEL
jgi:NAD binding domain of 6-phosphogluconate dehydrogenase